MPTARKQPSGNWKVRVYAGKGSNGKDTYKSFTADTKKKAESLAAAYTSKNKNPMTFGEAAEKLIAAKEHTLSPNSVRTYKIINNRLASLSLVRLDSLNSDRVQRVIDSLHNLSPKTIRTT